MRITCEDGGGCYARHEQDVGHIELFLEDWLSLKYC